MLSDLPKCNRDETKCRITGRCVPRWHLESKRGCKLEGIERHKIQCRQNGKINITKN